MDHLSDFMQLTYVTSARTCTRSCYGRFMQPGPGPYKIRNEMLRTGLKVLKAALFKLFNQILQSGSSPVLGVTE